MRGRAWLLATLLACFGLIQAQDRGGRIESMEVLEGASMALTVEQAAQAAFRPWPSAPSLLALGYQTRATWVRLRISGTGPLVLRIQPPYLDELRLYELTPAGWRERIAGDRYPQAVRERPHSAFRFDVTPAGGAPTVLYLRLVSSSSHIMDLQALSPAEAEAQARSNALYLGIYIGLILMVNVWAALQYAGNRDAVIGRFLAYQWVSLLMSLGLGGYLASGLPHHWAEMATNMLICAVTAFSIWFNRAYLAPFAPPPIFVWATRVLPLALPVQVGLIALGAARPAMASNALIALCVLTLCLDAAARVQAPPRGVRRWLVLTFAAQWVSVGPLMIALLGGPVWPITLLSGVVVHGAFASVLMFLLLSAHLRDARMAKRAAEQAARVMSERMGWEERQREMQSHFMDVLLHEMRSALAVVQLAAGALRDRWDAGAHEAGQRLRRLEQAASNMGAVVTRCQMVIDTEQGGRSVCCEPCRVLPVLQAHIANARLDEARLKLRVPEAVEVVADPQLLHWMLANLMDNAFKYAPSAATIEVEVQPVRCDGLAGEGGSDRARQSTSQSTGQGVGQGNVGWALRLRNALRDDDQPELQRLGTRYYRSPAARRQTGMGLGLYLVGELAKLQGGSARCAITVERQFEVTVLLPGGAP